MTSPTASDVVTSSRAGRREWTGLAVLMLPTIVLTMDLTVLHLAVPALTADLAPSATQLLWVIDVYGFLVAGLLLLMGNLGDRIGRRRLLLVGAAAFGVASVLAAFAWSAESLIAARALMGIAGATLMPSTMALLRTMFEDPAQRAAAIGVWMSGFMVGGALGPLVGGGILQVAPWGAVFLLAVPVMVLLLVVGPMLLPDSSDPEPGPIDLPSAATSIVAVMSLVYALKDAVLHGFGVATAVAALLGLALGTVFVRRQRSLTHPFLDVALFTRRRFSVAIVATTAGTAVMMGINMFVAQHLQLVHGLEPFTAGLWLLPTVVGMLLGIGVASALAPRVPPGLLIGAGFALSAASYVWLAAAADGGLVGFVLAASLAPVGLGPAAAVGANIVISSAPPARAGAASAISETSNELGGSLGLAVLGSIGAAVYGEVAGPLLPRGLPADVDAAVRDTVGGAAAVADRLPSDVAAQVLDAGREAFTSAVSVSGFVAAGVLAVVGLAVWGTLRGTPPVSLEDQEH